MDGSHYKLETRFKMALTGCSKCLKYLLFLFNLLFWLAGCAVLGIGIWIRVDPHFHQFVDIQYLYTASYILIGIGSAMMVICFMGCCGSLKENQCMLGTFWFFLLIIMLGVAGCMVAAYFKKDDVKDVITQTLRTAVKAYYDEENPWAKVMMDSVQEELNCCGADMASADYLMAMGSPPGSCNPLAYTTPCSKSVYDFIVTNFLIVVGIAVGLGMILIIGMVLTCCLLCAVRRDICDPYDYPKYSQ